MFEKCADRPGHVLCGPIERKTVHQVAGLVHLVVFGDLTVKQVGSERDEARFGQAVTHRLICGTRPHHS